MTMREEKLLEYLKTRDESPTQGEMKKAIGTKSNAILYQTLDRLEEAGLIQRDKGRWRGVALVERVQGSRFRIRDDSISNHAQRCNPVPQH